MFAYTYKEPVEVVQPSNADIEFCNAYLPECDSNPQSAAQALLSKKPKYGWKSMITEFLNCEEKKDWVIFHKSKVPKGRKTTGSWLVYTEKDDGTYRSLTVAKGFSQVPGKDFQEHHSPVVHDTTVCVVLVQKLVYNLHSRQFDTFIAFLYGLLDAPKTRPETGDDVLSPKDQTKYRSGVGMVLYWLNTRDLTSLMVLPMLIGNIWSTL
jgi:Reverse transcriptase (RNA-dependent DNA polymerase)